MLAVWNGTHGSTGGMACAGYGVIQEEKEEQAEKGSGDLSDSTEHILCSLDLVSIPLRSEPILRSLNWIRDVRRCIKLGSLEMVSSAVLPTSSQAPVA